MATFLNTALLSLCLLLATSALASAHTKPSHYEIKNPLVDEVCSKTPNKGLCIDMLAWNFDTNKADLNGLSHISIQGAMRKMRTNHMHIYNLLNRFHPESLQTKIRDCSANYDNVAVKLNAGLIELEKQQLCSGKAVAAYIDAAVKEVDACEAGCNSQAVETWVLTNRNNDLKAHCSVAKAIAQQLPN